MRLSLGIIDIIYKEKLDNYINLDIVTIIQHFITLFLTMVQQYYSEEDLRKIINSFPILQEPGYITTGQVAQLFNCSIARVNRFSLGKIKGTRKLLSVERSGQRGRFYLFEINEVIKFYIEYKYLFSLRVVNDSDPSSINVNLQESDTNNEIILNYEETQQKPIHNGVKDAIYFLQVERYDVVNSHERNSRIQDSISMIMKHYQDNLPENLNNLIEEPKEAVEKYKNTDREKGDNRKISVETFSEKGDNRKDNLYADQYIDFLKDQILAKDENIREKDEEISKLHNDTKNVLVALGDEKNRTKLLRKDVVYFLEGKIQKEEMIVAINDSTENEEERITADDVKVSIVIENVPEEEKTPITEKKRGFWSSLFGNK